MEWANTSHFGHGQRKTWLSWVHFWLVCSPEGGLGSRRVEIGCQDTDQIDGCKKDVIDAISLRNEPIPATLGMDKGKCGYLGCISGWFAALRGLRVKYGGLRVSGYRWK